MDTLSKRWKDSTVSRKQCKNHAVVQAMNLSERDRTWISSLHGSSMRSLVNLLSLTFYFFICKMRLIILPTSSVHVNCLTQYLTDSKHLINKWSQLLLLTTVTKMEEFRGKKHHILMKQFNLEEPQVHESVLME